MTEDVFDMVLSEEKISEEKKPSLYNLSLTDSVCSDTTIDLDALENSGTFYSSKDPNSNFESTPLENNFMLETTFESIYDNTELNETSELESPDNKCLNNNFTKYMSMHDVSDILPLQLADKSVNTVSCETIHSQSLSSTTKSKDSGFQRSISCLSLTSGKRNYDHVQSKVKAYIRNIKESEALRKKNKLKQQSEVIDEPVVAVVETETVLDKEDLISKIQELKHELHEKALFIDAQQRIYNSLLLKFAEAKNTIDTLRLQRISLSYKSLNESTNILSKYDTSELDSFLKDIQQRYKHVDRTRNSTTDLITCDKAVPVKEQLSETNDSLTEHFRPMKHSTPDKNESGKSLSPVSKMFSSSSRLDKNYKPLANLNKQTSHLSPPRCVSNINTQSDCPRCTAMKSKISTQNNASVLNNQKNQSSHIDLPNVDPFDKVRKWQEKLPSIDLLVTHSSSDCEETNMIRAHSFREYRDPSLPAKGKTTDINCSLSKELVAKCRISEMEGNSPPVNRYRESSKTHNYINSLENLKPDKNIRSNEVTNSKDEKKLNNYESNKFSVGNVTSCQACIRSRRNVSLFENKRRDFPAALASKSSSSTDSDLLSYLPKSSSLTQTADRVVRDVSSDSNDDSSSISSSVLGSSPPASITKSSKRRSPHNEYTFNKVPKFTISKKTRSNFILREPKLNVTIPVANVTEVKGKSSIATDSTNSNLNDARFRLESSQRKAWNARNNANFYVCKDFYFRKSSSLQECISLMEGLLEKGSSIIKSALDRTAY